MGRMPLTLPIAAFPKLIRLSALKILNGVLFLVFIFAIDLSRSDTTHGATASTMVRIPIVTARLARR